MPEQQKYTERKQLTGLWMRTSKSDPAKKYLGGTGDDGAEYSVFSNDYKQEGDNKPDYKLYVRYPLKEENEASEPKQAPAVTEDFPF